MRNLLFKVGLSLTFLVQFLVLSSVAQTTVEGPAFGSNPKVGQYFTTRGFKMYYEIYGQGKPLLMIHGNGGSIAAFKNQIPYFAQHYQVIVPDSRAQGKSADPADSLSFEMMADDFKALLDHLQIDSAFVLGWSDGGINGLLLAMRHPEKVGKLAITGANLWPDTTALIPEVYNDMVKTHAEMQSKKLTAKEKAELKLIDLDLYQPNIKLADLRAVKCETLVMGGDHDLIPVPHTAAIASHIRRAYLWILPNTGHSTLMERKDLFNREVDEFFKNGFKIKK